MKKAKRFLSILVAALLGAGLCSGLVACGEDNSVVTPPPAKAVSIKIDEAAATLKVGETVQLHVTVSNADDKTYQWSISDDAILEIDDNDVVSVVDGVRLTKSEIVTVTATANADKTKSASHTFTVQPSMSGSVGDLTAALFEEVSNASITFEGIVTDYYKDTTNPNNDSEDIYDMKVMMADGAWYGEWSLKSTGLFDFPTVTKDNYRRGESISSGMGHEFLRAYINKNNQVAYKTERRYDNTAVTWEEQHLWNHLGDLGTNIGEKWQYDTAYDEYVYQIEWSGETWTGDYTDDEWLMTYLAVSLTPMLSDTLGEFRIKLDADKEHIEKIWAKTVVQGYENSNGTGFDQQWWAEIELDILDVGKTVVPEPTPYEKDDFDDTYDDFVAALNKIASATNYTFQAVDTTLRAPSGSEGDMVPEDGGSWMFSLNSDNSTGRNASLYAATTPTGGYYKRHTKATGTVGRVGYVTENIILFEDTGMYTAYDGDPYYVDYSGYKQYNAGTPDAYYEKFATSTFDASVGEVKSLVATQRTPGNIFDKMPKFDFSPLVFQNEGRSTVRVGQSSVQVINYVLRDSVLTRDIAKEISASNEVSSAQALTEQPLVIQIRVDNHELFRTIFPYNILDAYRGYITTSYAAIGTTELDPACFTGENYIEREWKSSWSQYVAQYDDRTTKRADLTLAEFFGNATIPQPGVWMDVFGDQISGPWFREKDIYSESGYPDVARTTNYFTFTIKMQNEVLYDENGRQVPDEQLVGQGSKLAQEFAKLGFRFNPVQSGYYNKDKTMGYYTYTSDTVLIRIEVYGNAHLYIDIYKIGDWQYPSSYPKY